MLGSEEFGDVARVRKLVVAVFGEADREGLDRLRHVLGHQGDDQARVEPAAQHRAEWDVAHQAQAHRFLEARDQLLGELVLRRLEVRLRHRVRPVALEAQTTRVDDQPLARHQLANAGQRRERSRDEAEGHVGVDRLVVELGLDDAARQHALQLRGEDDAVAGLGVVERLDAEPVARDHEAPLAPVPDRHPELAANALRERQADLLVEVRQDLGVAVAREAVAAEELAADVLVVVELAVLDGPDGGVLVADRLVAAFHVDDAEPPDAERDSGLEVRAAVVRPAVRHGIGHPIEHVRLDHEARFAPDLNDSTDPAHDPQPTVVSATSGCDTRSARVPASP